MLSSEVAAMNDSNIRRVSNLYAAHQFYKGRAPNED